MIPAIVNWVNDHCSNKGTLKSTDGNLGIGSQWIQCWMKWWACPVGRQPRAHCHVCIVQEQRPLQSCSLYKHPWSLPGPIRPEVAPVLQWVPALLHVECKIFSYVWRPQGWGPTQLRTQGFVSVYTHVSVIKIKTYVGWNFIFHCSHTAMRPAWWSNDWEVSLWVNALRSGSLLVNK